VHFFQKISACIILKFRFSKLSKISWKYLEIRGQNNFAEKSKILINTDLKIILLNHQNNFVEVLKIMSNVAKNFDILAISLSVLHNYFDSSAKLSFCIQPKF